MTNYEWILENRKDIVKEALRDTIALSNGEIVLCNSLKCEDCDFYCKGVKCSKVSEDFLSNVHKESSIKIAKDTPLHTPIWVRNYPNAKWELRFFAGFENYGIIKAYIFSYYDDEQEEEWNYAKPYVPGVDPEKEETEND